MREVGQSTVVSFVTDLLFSVRIEEAVRAAGASSYAVTDAESLWRAIDCWPALALLDLQGAPGWEQVVRRAKSLPHTRTVPIVAFGSHVQTEALRTARAAGCDHAWARSRFFGELPNLVRSVLHPPIRWVAGWDETPPASLLAGIEQFNRGEYWECHETLEKLWVEEGRDIRDLYQGVLQIGVAFHHLRDGNYPGAVKMLRRGIPRLRDLPASCQGVAVAELVGQAYVIHERIVALGPDRLAEFELALLPSIACAAAAI